MNKICTTCGNEGHTWNECPAIFTCSVCGVKVPATQTTEPVHNEGCPLGVPIP